jgi:alkyldihydroxyacetonephosphate synthase
MRWLMGRISGHEPAGGEESEPETAVSPAELPRSELSEPALTALRSAVGERNVLAEHAARLGRTGGLSYLDLLRRRLDEPVALPDAVITPADPVQVQEVLEVCRKHDIAVVPFGGGTSVVGGVNALRGDKSAVVALDLVRLDKLVEVDPVSRLAVLQAGMRGPVAERLLAGHGLTLGHVPQSFERATIGGFVATRSAGQASAGYGRFEDMVQGLRVATPAGEWRLGCAPASAAGPDLRQLVCGSEGVLGVITEATVRVRPAPSERHYVGLVLDGWQRGIDAVRALAQKPALADVTRLSDVDETDVGLAMSSTMRTRLLRRYLRTRSVSEPCLLVLGWEETSIRSLSARRSAAMSVLRRFAPVSLGTTAGRAWLRGRFAEPRLRDALIAAGVCVETLETATRWSALPALAESVRSTLVSTLSTKSARPLVLCHVSHAYETGASLYFTVLVPRSPRDAIGQWQRAKQAASDVIAAADATITHQHAIGTDHRPWLAAELGERGVGVLRAVKQSVDPTGILNPGKLI